MGGNETNGNDASKNIWHQRRISNIDDKLCQHFTPLFNFDVRDPVQIVRQTTQLPQTPLDLKDIRVAVLAIGLLVSFPQMIQFRVEIVMLVTKSII